jgi:two-component system, NtrC family, response regulator AtoC
MYAGYANNQNGELQLSSKGYAKGNFHADITAPLHARLLGNHPRIREINSFIGEVARTNLTVFITGETGTGKDIVASLIHTLSARAKKPFIKINFPSIPEGILENELFGHERGAFTGAHSSRPGRFELARDGTVFMDEIFETSLQVQSKLTQVLDGEPFMRVGGVRQVQMKARVIAAANIGLEEAVARGKLRNDIAFRLKEVVIQLPSLRSRREDIPLLAEHFNCHACKMMGKEYQELGPEIWEHLKTLYWKGNVRQLATRVKEFVVTGSDSAILAPDSEDSADSSGGNGKSRRGGSASMDSGNGKKQFMPLNEARRLAAENAERALIEETLRYTLWNRRKAAKLLSTSYSSLLRRIDMYKIGKS